MGVDPRYRRALLWAGYGALIVVAGILLSRL
jgi:hypothetical protein